MSEKTCDLDYRAEYKRLKEEIFRIQEKKKDYECKITDLQLTIAELRGKIQAYEFAITKGGVDNG